MGTYPHTTSFWGTGQVSPENALMGRAIDVDVAIIGGGFAGISAAYYIKKAKPDCRVAILEKDYIGFGPSGRNFGAVVPGLRELRTVFLTDLDPVEESFAQTWYLAARAELERRIAEGGIECEYRSEPLLMVSTDAEGWAAQQREAELLLTRGTPHKLLDRDAIGEAMALPFEVFGGIVRTEWCAAQPYKLSRGLGRQVRSLGVAVHEGTCVEEVEDDGSRVVIRTTDGGRISAPKAVLATNAYTVHLPEFCELIFPRHTHVLATEVLDDATFASLGYQMYKFVEDAGLTFYYSRVYQNRLLMGGGPSAAGLFTPSPVDKAADHNDLEFDRIYEEMQRRFPQLRGVQIDAAWGGPVDMTPNFMPIIAPLANKPNVITSLGYCGDGLLNASSTGLMVRGLVLGEDYIDADAERVRQYMLRP